MELRSIIRGLIAVLGLGAVLALLYRLITQNKRLTHEDSPPTSPAPADGTDIGSVVAAKKLAKNLRKKSKGDIETKELPRQVSRAASIRTNLVKDDDSSAWELKGEYAAFLSHYKLECAMEARHCQAELEGMLGAPVFLDSDDLSDLTKLLDQVEESDILLLFQSRNVLCRPYCLLELYTAVEKGIPIVAMRVRGANEYQFDEATAFLKHLDTELDRANPGASKLLQKHGVDLRDMAFKLSMAVPNLISIDFNPSGSRNNLKASLLDVAQTMRIATPSIVDDEEKS